MEVAFSQQLFLLSLKKNIILLLLLLLIFFFEVYFATGNREVGAQNLKLQFAVPYHVVSSLSHVQERRPWKMGGDLIVIDQLTMNSCVASGVFTDFHLVFSPHNFSSLRFFRGFFSRGCTGHMPKINYFSVGSPQLVHLLDPIYSGCMRLVHVVCTLRTLSLVAALTKLLHTLHMGC